MIRRIREGDLLPPWYGCAWLDYSTLEMVCLPLGLNVIARILRSMYTNLRHIGTAVHTEPRQAYHQGYVQGLKGRKQ